MSETDPAAPARRPSRRRRALQRADRRPRSALIAPGSGVAVGRPGTRRGRGGHRLMSWLRHRHELGAVGRPDADHRGVPDHHRAADDDRGPHHHDDRAAARRRPPCRPTTTRPRPRPRPRCRRPPRPTARSSWARAATRSRRCRRGWSSSATGWASPTATTASSPARRSWRSRRSRAWAATASPVRSRRASWRPPGARRPGAATGWRSTSSARSSSSCRAARWQWTLNTSTGSGETYTTLVGRLGPRGHAAGRLPRPARDRRPARGAARHPLPAEVLQRRHRRARVGQHPGQPGVARVRAGHERGHGHDLVVGAPWPSASPSACTERATAPALDGEGCP